MDKNKKLREIVLGCEMGSDQAISQIKALVIESLGEEVPISMYMNTKTWLASGYNQHRTEMKEKWG